MTYQRNETPEPLASDSTQQPVAETFIGPRRLDCRNCWKQIAVRSAFGYCADCQAIHDECNDPSRIQPRTTTLHVYRNSVGRASHGIIDHQTACDLFDGMTEADWQDALQPNEGCR